MESVKAKAIGVVVCITLIFSLMLTVNVASQRDRTIDRYLIDDGCYLLDGVTEDQILAIVNHIDQFHMEHMEDDHDSTGQSLDDINNTLNNKPSKWETLTFTDEFIESCIEDQPTNCIWTTNGNNTNIEVVDHLYNGILRMNIDWNGYSNITFDNENIPFSIDRNLSFTTYLKVEELSAGNVSFGMGPGLTFFYNYQWGPNITIDINGTYQDTGIDIDTDWHLFEIITNKDIVKFIMDSNIVFESTTNIPENGFWPQFLIEAHYSGATMDIDFVEVTQNRY